MIQPVFRVAVETARNIIHVGGKLEKIECFLSKDSRHSPRQQTTLQGSQFVSPY